jgi:hypothetical protein
MEVLHPDVPSRLKSLGSSKGRFFCDEMERGSSPSSEQLWNRERPMKKAIETRHGARLEPFGSGEPLERLRICTKTTSKTEKVMK